MVYVDWKLSFFPLKPWKNAITKTISDYFHGCLYDCSFSSLLPIFMLHKKVLKYIFENVVTTQKTISWKFDTIISCLQATEIPTTIDNLHSEIFLLLI